MPPSGHSSSHHSSSSHSSHSSSHHSSSSHSSSRSSHSSSHHSSYSGSSSASRISYTSVHRNRTSQPYGWNASKHGAVSHFYCKDHDYDYYSKGWTAPDGKHFEEGYYDENGRHYGNVIMAGGTTMLKCAYCGNRMAYKWKEGDLPICNKCGAQFEIDITDKEKETDKSVLGSILRALFPNTSLALKLFIGVILFSSVFPFIIFLIGGYMAFRDGDASGVSRYEAAAVQNSIYVEEIGRTCYLDGKDWYDAQTQCWFYYNADVSPYQWQYWYEGISSDYGDYGWMEYDMNEDVWYIETEDGKWVHLPTGYDTSQLWHMTDEYTNEYE